VNHTVEEQVTWCLACQCRPGDVLVVGVATPIAAAAGQLARALLVPDLVLIEAAAVDVASHDVATAMVRPESVSASAVGVYSQAQILDAIQRGRISVQFISPAQVDGAGALNTSRVRGKDGGLRRLPGGLATADIARLMGRLVVYRIGHERRFLPERVDFGTASASGWRRSTRARRWRRSSPAAGLRSTFPIGWRPPSHPRPRPCASCARRSTRTACCGSRAATAARMRSALSRGSPDVRRGEDARRRPLDPGGRDARP
jgi:acyl CoA:acetate/3-ketoacid CoA transferase beta subunit